MFLNENIFCVPSRDDELIKEKMFLQKNYVLKENACTLRCRSGDKRKKCFSQKNVYGHAKFWFPSVITSNTDVPAEENVTKGIQISFYKRIIKSKC